MENEDQLVRDPAGRFYAAKPNLYLSGKSGTPFKVKVTLKAGGNWLAASPVHGKVGWSGKLQQDEKLEAGGAKYSYLYYDYRVDEKPLQDGAGFCVEREQLIPKMAEGLKAGGFAENEIRDFVQHWSVKIPPSKRYCVYPQGNSDLNQVAELQIEPKPRSITRLLYAVVVDEGLSGSGKKFTQVPKRNWEFSRTSMEARVPASEQDGLVVREWGVGFLQADR